MFRFFWDRLRQWSRQTQRRQARRVAHSRPRRFRPLLEELDQRVMLSITVMNTNDSGAGSLRDAINQVNAGTVSDNTIILPAGHYTISSAEHTEETNAPGGDFDITHDIIIQGAGSGSTIIDGNQQDRVFDIQASGVAAQFFDLTIENGQIADGTDGAGIRAESGSDIVMLTNSVVTNNDAVGGAGGGIAVSNSGSVSLTNSVVSFNKSSGGGGISATDSGVTLNLSNVHDNTASGGFFDGGGGGIKASSVSGTTSKVSVTDSTIDHNMDVNGQGGGGILTQAVNMVIDRSTISNNSTSSGGGGIDVSLVPDSEAPSPTVSITNSTISTNHADVDGGGILNEFGSVTSLTNVTVTLNTASGDGGGVDNEGNTVTLLNTIVAGNTGTQGGPDVDENFVSLGHNLIGISDDSTGFTNGANGDQVGSSASPIDPKLGPLADNGGPTQTHALLLGSPAIDAGQDGVVATDQRGVSRPQGPHTDIGAYELIAGVQGLSGTATISGNEFNPLTNVPVATFTIPGGGVSPGSINATIDWGDTTGTTTGTITQSGSSYTVLGSHSYAERGNFTITTTVSVNGASASAGTSAVMGEELLPGQGTPGTLTDRLIAEYYRDLLGKSVDALGLQVWGSALNSITQSLALQYMADGLSFSLSYGLAFFQASQEVAQAIAVAGGFQAPGGDAMAVLQANYEALLDRPFGPHDPTVYLTLLQSGVSDQVVVSLIAASSEYINKVA